MQVERLENRDVPSSAPALESEYGVGRDVGGPSIAILYNADKSLRYSVMPYGPTFTGGIRTAAADFSGDGVADLVVASGPGRTGNVRVIDGVSKSQLFDLNPFGDIFTRGITVIDRHACKFSNSWCHLQSA